MLELCALFRPIFGIDTGKLCQAGELPAHFAIWSALAQRRAFAHGVVERLRIVIHIQAPDETGAERKHSVNLRKVLNGIFCMLWTFCQRICLNVNFEASTLWK